MNALRFALGIFSGIFILILQTPADCGLPGFAFSRKGRNWQMHQSHFFSSAHSLHLNAKSSPFRESWHRTAITERVIFREDKGLVQVHRHQICRHEAPDDGLAQDDRIVLEFRDEHQHKDHLAHQLDHAGEQRQHLLAKALQRVAGAQQHPSTA